MFGSSGVFFFGFSSSVKMSLLFVCDTTDSNDGDEEGDDKGDNDSNDDGNKDKETLVDNQLDTVDGVDGDINNFVEEVFFSFVETNNLPFLFFWGVSKILPSLAMV